MVVAVDIFVVAKAAVVKAIAFVATAAAAKTITSL